MSAARPVAVTGATGNVGREVARALRARGVPVRAAVRDVASRGDLGDDVARAPFDFDRPETFDALVAGARALFLMRPPAIADVKRTLHALVDRAIASGVEHVVFLSVTGADRQFWLPHYTTERFLERRGVAWTFLRAGFFAQNLQTAYLDDIREGTIVLPAGRGRVAFVDARDLGEAAAIAFDDPAARRAAWTLTGGEPIDFDEVARLLSRASGRLVRYAPTSAVGYVRHLRRRGVPWGQAAVQTLLHLGIRSGNAAAVSPDLARVLGRSPRTLDAYVRDLAPLWNAR